MRVVDQASGADLDPSGQLAAQRGPGACSARMHREHGCVHASARHSARSQQTQGLSKRALLHLLFPWLLLLGRLCATPMRAGGGGGRLSDEPPELNSIHRGEVKRIEAYGVFVALQGFRKYGLVHASQVRARIVRRCWVCARIEAGAARLGGVSRLALAPRAAPQPGACWWRCCCTSCVSHVPPSALLRCCMGVGRAAMLRCCGAAWTLAVPPCIASACIAVAAMRMLHAATRSRPFLSSETTRDQQGLGRSAGACVMGPVLASAPPAAEACCWCHPCAFAIIHCVQLFCHRSKSRRCQPPGLFSAERMAR